MSQQTKNPMECSHALFRDRLLFALVLTWTFLSLCFPLLDTDFWWHLKTGEWILENGQIPYVDFYTFMDSERPWVDIHWGFQIFICLLYRIGGISLVTLVKAGVITGAVAIAWEAGGCELTSWKKSVIWLLPIVCVTGRGNERPEMLSQFFLAIWLWIATRSEKQPRLIWWLPLVQLVWVNCHALFVLGLVVGFCYGADAIVRELANGRFGNAVTDSYWKSSPQEGEALAEPRTGNAHGIRGFPGASRPRSHQSLFKSHEARFGLLPRINGPEFRIVWFVGGLVTLSCFINPYFEEGAIFPLTLYRKFSVEKDFYCKNIGEFQQPIEFFWKFGISNVYLTAEICVWLITAASFVWLLIEKRQWSVFRMLLFAGYSHLAWQASRNTNFFALVSAFIACENLAQAFQPGLEVKTKVFQITNSSHRVLLNLMSALYCSLSFLVVSGYWNDHTEKNKPFGLGESPNWFIHKAAKFAGQPGFPDRAFVANIGQAEVYVYHNAPNRRVFMDARLEVCTQKTFELYNQILFAMAAGNPVWESLFYDGELPVVILDSRASRPAINGMLATPTWRLVFADRAAAVFLRVERAEKLHLSVADPTPLMYPDGEPKSPVSKASEGRQR